MRIAALGCLVACCLGCGGGGDGAVDAGGDPPDAGGGAGWSTVAPLPQARQETGVGAVAGRVYVIGGFIPGGAIVDTVEAYDPATDSWAQVAPLPQTLHHANVAVVGDKLYVLGALRSLTFTAIGDVYEYDPAADTWTPRAPMPAGTERGGSGVGVIGDAIYIAGGSRGGSVDDFSYYDTLTDTWLVLPPLPEPRDHLVGGSWAGVFFAFGGRNGGIGDLRDRVDIWDPAAGAWASGAPMPTPRGGCAAAMLGRNLHVFGGEGNPDSPSGVFADHEVYDLIDGTWTVLDPMLTPRHGTGAATLNGKIYIPGGADQQAFGAVATVDVWEP